MSSENPPPPEMHKAVGVQREVAILERREHERIPCERAAACTPADDEVRVWQGWAVDVSRGGIQVVADHRFEPGSELRIVLALGPGGTMRTLQARVVRVTQETEGQWLIGCRLGRELRDAELKTLVSTSSVPTPVEELPQ